MIGHISLVCRTCDRTYTVPANMVTLDLAESRLWWHCTSCRTTHRWTLRSETTLALSKIVPPECRADAITDREIDSTVVAMEDDRQLWRELEGATR